MKELKGITYIVEKSGIYSHGVFWIGDDIEKAKAMADKYAECDRDDYHDWYVCEFAEVHTGESIYPANHKPIYVAKKGIHGREV